MVVTGSLNGLMPQDKVVDTKGWIKWNRSTSAFYPYFTTTEK